MNAERLLQHYEQIADAPNAIARLRRFILDLAVRGKLVPQDSGDEPASELLKQIEFEKARLEKRSTAKGRALVELRPQSMAFTLPASWRWLPATYPALIILEGDRKVQTKDVLDAGLYPVIDQGKVFIRGYCNDHEKVIHPESPIILFGDHTRQTKLIDFSFVVGADGVKLLQPIGLASTYYFLAIDWLPLESRGYGRHFKLLKESWIPLPPLAEQHRIVAKVDELMALCDELEAARTERERKRDRLAAASLARLNTPDPETFRDDARFALDTLPALTARPDQIKQLRQTILNLAVRGKLVPQDPADEPAEELLKRLKKERTALEQAGRIRREKGVRLSDDFIDQSFELPRSWCWARLTELGQTQTGTSPSSSNPDLFGDFIPFIKPGDLDGNQINYRGPGLSEIGVAHSRLAAENSILMVCIGATLGKVNTTVRPVCFNQQINSLTPFLNGLTAFVAMALRASSFQRLAWSNAGTGTLPIISKGKWEVLPIPLPPLTEQRRIVAKVDELMALCDQLETGLTSADDTRRRLLDALLAEALAPVDAKTLQEAAE